MSVRRAERPTVHGGEEPTLARHEGYHAWALDTPLHCPQCWPGLYAAQFARHKALDDGVGLGWAT